MDVYDKIAGDFAQSRNNSWEEFELFDDYVKPGQNILDIGCGSGRLCSFLQEKEVNYTGCDSSSKLLSLAQKKFPRNNFVFGDFRDLPFEDKSFDLVFAIASFHHLMDFKDQKKGVAEMARVLKKDGILCLTVWNLFQKKYRHLFFKNIFKRIYQGIFPFGVLVPFGQQKVLRPYFTFTPNRLKSKFAEHFFCLKEIHSIGKKKSNFPDCRNICLILKKQDEERVYKNSRSEIRQGFAQASD